MHHTKTYELTNHLGNVLTVLSDRKIAVVNVGGTTIDHFSSEILTANDYYAFGFEIKNRAVNSGSTYAYGFNGKRKDLETETQDYGFRIYNPSLGRFLSVDPLTAKYPWYSPYQFAGNKPIWALDLDGMEEWIYVYYFNKGQPIKVDKINNIELRVDEAASEANGGTVYKAYNKATGKVLKNSEYGQAQYQYYNPSNGDMPDERVHMRRNNDGDFVPGDNELMTDWTFNYEGSVYAGPNNPPEINGKPDYRREPMNEPDLIGKIHDQDFDKSGLKGGGGVLSTKSTPLNIKAMNAADSYLNRKTDKVTGKLQTSADRKLAFKLKEFSFIEVLKMKLKSEKIIK